MANNQQSHSQESDSQQSHGQQSHSQQSIQILITHIENHAFGINLANIRDILFDQMITPIPLSKPDVMGAINLRGNIVTVINMRKRLGLPDFPKDYRKTHVIIEYKEELFDLALDKVGEVITLDQNLVQPTPIIVDAAWQKLMNGIVKQKDSVLSLLNTDPIVSLMF